MDQQDQIEFSGVTNQAADMAETLSGILLVTKSANESMLVFRWPPSPKSSPRLSRPKPSTISVPLDLDNPWRASNYPALPSEDIKFAPDDAKDYEWKRPASFRDRIKGFSHPASHPTSGRNSPTKDGFIEHNAIDEYDHVYTYSSDFLGVILCPQQGMCHQKFELIVDDLAFIGHPVCAEKDVDWKFMPEKQSKGSSTRGRESRSVRSQHPSPDRASSSDRVQFAPSSWLQLFHLVFVLDLPDPSSSASGNLSKYYDIIYEQIAFVVTAVLFQEQVCNNFVERECEDLGKLKEHCIAKGEPFSSFVAKALQASSIASTMKILFDSIKSNSMAYLSINNIPLELQLPPFLDDHLLHSTEDVEIDFAHHPDDEGLQAWGPDMTYGWRLPTLAPWKSLLLLDDTNRVDTTAKNIPTTHEDRILIDGLVRFLETASVTLSLADMASLLDWDLETQIFPTVRWLVQHRRAKVVDLVHSGLKTVFTLPPKFDYPLAQLTEEFDQQFSPHGVPPLPKILATIATSISKQTDNHFFASVVQSKKENIPIYQDVILWMLKRDLLITLHLRIRIVVTRDIKIRVRVARDNKRKNKQDREQLHSGLRQELDANGPFPGRGGYGHGVAHPHTHTHGHGALPWLSFSPKSVHRHIQKIPSAESMAKRRDIGSGGGNLAAGSGGAGGHDHPGMMDEEYEDKGLEDDEEDDEDDDDEDDIGWNTAEDHLWPSIIPDPGRATPLQRRWLSAMSEKKPAHIARRFELINQYFDGKKTDDEILYRAEISRKHLREVLHHYDEYLQTFLHPS
ncbi:hypothetical protein AX16_010190 [Volvariella volvacea WC 439]|nr:hypothetical protein AX16_010190 [Volvariella volvacea WC 439]